MNLGLHYFIMNNYWQKRIFDKPRQIIDQFSTTKNNRKAIFQQHMHMDYGAN